MAGFDVLVSLNRRSIAALSLFLLNFFLKKFFFKHPYANEFIQRQAVILVYKDKVQYTNLIKAESIMEALGAALRELRVENSYQVYFLATPEIDGNTNVISNDFKKRTIQPVSHQKKHQLKGKIK